MTLAEDLLKLECPINWGLPNRTSAVEDARKKLLLKIGNEIGEDDSSTWQKICQCLVLAVLEYNSPNEDLEAMGNYIQKIEDVLKEDKGIKGDTLKKKHVPPIKYVTEGVKAFWHYKKKDEEKALFCLLSIASFDKLSKEDQAAIFALRACCFMEFALDGNVAALKHINEALKLDSDDPEWNFLKGKCLARTRRLGVTSVLPEMEELDCLGKAVKSEDCSPYHLVFCGQSLLEYAQAADFVKRNAETTRIYKTKCAELLRKAAEKGENNGVILIRVAKGLMHMYGFGIEDLLENCVFRSLELLPTSGFVNAVVGEWYHVRKKDINQAIPYLRTAARDHKIMSSYHYLLSILFLYKPEELDEEIEGYWDNFKDDSVSRVKALKFMSAYYFFVRDDIVKATTCWKEYIERLSKEGHSINNRTTMFVFSYNFTSTLVGEVNCVLKDPQSQLNSDDEEKLRSFLEVVKETMPHEDVSTNQTSRKMSIRECVINCKDFEKKEILSKKYKINLPNRSKKYDCNGRQSDRSDNRYRNPDDDRRKWSDDRKFDKRDDDRRKWSDGRKFDDGRKWSDDHKFDDRRKWSDDRKFDDRTKLSDDRKFDDGRKWSDDRKFDDRRKWSDDRNFGYRSNDRNFSNRSDGNDSRFGNRSDNRFDRNGPWRTDKSKETDRRVDSSDAGKEGRIDSG